MQIIETITNTLKDLDWKVQITVAICVLAGFLAFVHYGGLTASSEPETAPTTTTKTVEGLNVEAKGDINGINISQ